METMCASNLGLLMNKKNSRKKLKKVELMLEAKEKSIFFIKLKLSSNARVVLFDNLNGLFHIFSIRCYTCACCEIELNSFVFQCKRNNEIKYPSGLRYDL